MMDLLRDPVWQFIGAILAIIAIGISIFIYLVQRQLKKLSYELISTTSLLSVAEEVKGKLKILYDDKPVSNVHLVIISFTNTGNVPIIESDFVNPVRIVFSENAKILAAETFELTPENLNAKIEIDNQSIRIAPTLLNSGDLIKIKLLISDYDQKIKVEGRIVGIKKIDSYKKQNSNFRLYIIGVAISVPSMIAGMLVDYNLETTAGKFLAGFASIGALLLLPYVFSELWNILKKLVNKVKF